jgi:hypothetical protein
LPPASDGFHHIRYFGFMANGCRAKMSRKRHILVDTLGLLLGVSVLPANIQDRDGGSGSVARGAAAFSIRSSGSFDIRARKWPKSQPAPDAGRSR